MFRSLLSLVVIAASQTGCRGPVVVEQIGAMREVMRDGQTEGRISLLQVADPDAVAVGALEGLAGEVTILDGQVWVTRVSEGGGVLANGPAAGQNEAATLLTIAHVSNWQTVAIDDPIPTDQLEDAIREVAAQVGLDTSQPFPFVLETDQAELNLHVINGFCPLAAGSQQTDKTPWRGQLPETPARLVGFFAPNAAGVMTHHGTALHVHALVEQDGQLITGHLDSIAIDGPSRVKLPG